MSMIGGGINMINFDDKIAALKAKKNEYKNTTDDLKRIMSIFESI